jgi:tetratricopeptide (TPR) repeat protein
MPGHALRASLLGWVAGLGLSAAVIQVFVSVINVRWVPRFEIWTTEGEGIFAILGVFLGFMWWLLAFKLAVEAMRAGATGPGHQSQRDRWIDDEAALGQVVLWAGLLLSGYALFLNFGRTTLAVYCALVAVLLPAILPLLGMEESLKRAFDPGAWRLLLQHVGGGNYLFALAKLLGIVVLVAFVQFALLPPMASWLHWSVVQMVWVGGLFGGYHELGRMVGGHPGKVDAGASVEAPAAQLTEEEDLAMRAAARLGADQRFFRAARELEMLVRCTGTSHAVHASFRELLRLAGEQVALLAHARRYVPELVSLGKASEALALYQESLASDPHFELAQPATITKVIEAARDARQAGLALALAREFLRRFPDDADAVTNGLSAARLLDRQGREDESRQLLVELVRRFPQHPLRAELVAALETLESAARRSR